MNVFGSLTKVILMSKAIFTHFGLEIMYRSTLTIIVSVHIRLLDGINVINLRDYRNINRENEIWPFL